MIHLPCMSYELITTWQNIKSHFAFGGLGGLRSLNAHRDSSHPRHLENKNNTQKDTIKSTSSGLLFMCAVVGCCVSSPESFYRSHVRAFFACFVCYSVAPWNVLHGVCLIANRTQKIARYPICSCSGTSAQITLSRLPVQSSSFCIRLLNSLPDPHQIGRKFEIQNKNVIYHDKRGGGDYTWISIMFDVWADGRSTHI